MGERDPDPAKENPENVHDCREASRCRLRMTDIGAEGEEGEKGELDALEAERDADHGKTKRKATQEIFEEQNVWEMWLLKNDVPFALITQNKSKITNGFHMANNLNDKNHPIITLEPSDLSGHWRNLSVSNIGYDFHKGIMLEDLNFDGEFDYEMIIDGNNKLKFIRIEGDWVKINTYDSNNVTASYGNTKYIFKEGTGWIKQ